jgi:hypothetical protein
MLKPILIGSAARAGLTKRTMATNSASAMRTAAAQTLESPGLDFSLGSHAGLLPPAPASARAASHLSGQRARTRGLAEWNCSI